METQDFFHVDIRPASILTNSYVAGTVIDGTDTINSNKRQVNLFNQMILNIAFTKGDLDDVRIKIEQSYDGITYKQLTTESSPTSGVITLSPRVYKYSDSVVNISVPIPIKYRYIKVSALGTGTVTGSSLALDAELGNAGHS